MRLWAIALLLAGCTRPAPAPPTAKRPDLTLSHARVRAWDAHGLTLDARAPVVAVDKGAARLEAHDASLRLAKAGAQVEAKVLVGDLAGAHLEAPEGATLVTDQGVRGAAPHARYDRGEDGGVFSGEAGVTLSDPDAGFSLKAERFELDAASQRARFTKVETVVGAPR